MRPPWKCLAVCLVPLLTYPLWPARAHGDYAWINDGAYRALDGSHCCGVSDCKQIDRGDVGQVNGGYATPHGFVPGRATYQSRDGKTWICRWRARPASRCLFIPGAS